jgi:hypothetical protein
MLNRKIACSGINIADACVYPAHQVLPSSWNSLKTVTLALLATDKMYSSVIPYAFRLAEYCNLNHALH